MRSFMCVCPKKHIIVNFIIQRLKNKHISIKKYTDWAILGHVTQNSEFRSSAENVALICQQKKIISLVSESLFSLVSSSFFSGCLWILTLLRWLRIKSRCCSNSESNSYHTVCIDNGDDYCSEDCSSGPSFINSYSLNLKNLYKSFQK